jgi:hypothetical protein
MLVVQLQQKGIFDKGDIKSQELQAYDTAVTQYTRAQRMWNAAGMDVSLEIVPDLASYSTSVVTGKDRKSVV